MTRALLLAVLVGCAGPAPQVDSVLVRDPLCGPTASEDCFELVEHDQALALPDAPFEMVVHWDGELDTSGVTANGEPVDVVETDRAVGPDGTHVALLVPALPFGRIEVGDFTLFARNPALSAHYPSGYNSNCSCAFCIAYCLVDGQTRKSGTCC